MPSKILHSAVWLAAILLVFPPSQNAQESQPQVRPTVNGIAIPDIPDAPFSATVVIEFDRYFPDGSTQVRRTINLIARDSQGRTHNESRRLMPEYFHGSPPLTGIHLFDPTTRIRTICDPALQIAQQDVIPMKPKAESPPNPLVRIEDLGIDTLNGLPAKGTRRILNVSSGHRGNGKPIEVIDENWYSQDLHIDLLFRHSDPRIGVETAGVSGLAREEPPSSMFRVPPGYRILEAAPAPAPTPPAEPKPTAAGAVPNP